MSPIEKVNFSKVDFSKVDFSHSFKKLNFVFDNFSAIK